LGECWVRGGGAHPPTSADAYTCPSATNPHSHTTTAYSHSHSTATPANTYTRAGPGGKPYSVR
jgi:hypothetical protein